MRHEARVAQSARGVYAIIVRPERRNSLVEVCSGISLTRDLLATFGGRITRLPADWQTRFDPPRAEPVRIGKRLSIVNAKSKTSTQAGRVLIIPAAAAFGTGEHVTTAMSLRLLEQISRAFPRGWRMLDAGTGSGILALAGRCFGAETVVAIDSDPLAISTAMKNARANNIRGIQFLQADVMTQKLSGKFDIITANLFSELLISALPQWKRLLRGEGRLILSGVLRRQEHELIRAINLAGLAAERIRRRGKWIACLAGHSTKLRRQTFG
jgi:ribosomal protein L11 methyltransferase